MEIRGREPGLFVSCTKTGLFVSTETFSISPDTRLPRSERTFEHVRTLAQRHPKTKFVSIVGDKCIPDLPDSRQPMLIIYRDGEIQNQIVAWGGDRERRLDGEHCCDDPPANFASYALSQNWRSSWSYVAQLYLQPFPELTGTNERRILKMSRMMSDGDRGMGQEVPRIGQQKTRTKIQGQSWICNIRCYLPLRMYKHWIIIIHNQSPLECDANGA